MHFTIEFDKNANSVGGMCFNTHSIKLCFATVGVCVFYALAPADAFFCFFTKTIAKKQKVW